MSYPQAFHTSCRSGLSGHAGFQFNAASADLDQRQLSSLAAAHAGYRAAPDTPPEPGPEEIERLPVALRYLPVEGSGPVISRTAYVGREFRGRDGEPDSGRFGNYFSHIVVGDGDGSDPFGGLMPIELWAAPHWSTEEAAATELPRLERIEPGPVDLEAVLAQLLPARAGALAPVLDACLRALTGGPRVVLVEPEPALAPAWIAWVSFALPPDRVGQLTFSTFEGRPRVAEGVRVCVTTPACELDFPPYDLGRTVAIVDAAAPEGGDLSLYARVAAALAGAGAEAVAAATRELEPGLGLEQAGATLAVCGRRTDLAAAAEVGDVLAVIRRRAPDLGTEAASALATALPEEVGSPATLTAWGQLHAAAREGTDDDPRLVDLTLARVLGAFERADEIEPVAPQATVAPSVGALAGWSSMVSEAAGSERLGEVIGAGVRLRLVGCNSALDRELAAAIAADLGDAGVRRAFDQLAAAGNETVVAGAALEIAQGVGAGGSVAPLRYVARYPAAREAVRERAEDEPGFEMAAAWEVLQVADDPAKRPRAVARLAELATTERQAELIRDLYGEQGPADAREHAELLQGWAAAGRTAPADDCRRALDCLATLPLRREPATVALFTALGKAPKSVRRIPEYAPWWLLFESPPERGFFNWADQVRRAQPLFSKAAEPRQREVGALAARVAAAGLGEERYSDGVDVLVETLGVEWLSELGDALGGELDRDEDPEYLVALAFFEWQDCRRHGRELLEEALPRATRDLSPRRLEAIGERFEGSQREEWAQWLEAHPPGGAVSRAVRGVFRRGEDRP